MRSQLLGSPGDAAHKRPGNPDLYLAYYNVGHTYKLLNDKVHATEWLDKFIKGYGSKAGPELSKAASDEIYALDAP